MMKAVTYKGIYSPIVKNNGVEITIRVAKGEAKGSTLVVPYAEFSERQQKMLARNTTCVEYKEVTSYMDPNVKVKIPVDTPRSCDPSTELYWSL
jgi:hypothetical protein